MQADEPLVNPRCPTVDTFHKRVYLDGRNPAAANILLGTAALEGRHFMTGLKGRTILVADDERYITTTLSLKLRQAGANVIVAYDGSAALEMACAHRPDLIVTDLQMARMSGLELSERLKATPATCRIPIVMLTARGHRLTPTDLARTSVRLLLAKPFSARELMVKLEEVASELTVTSPEHSISSGLGAQAELTTRAAQGVIPE